MNEVVGLNWLPGVAALLVATGHARAFFMVDYADVANGESPFVKAFYFLTSLGSIAVMIFFVLSGYLIAGSVHSRWERGQWNWSEYLLARLTRLLVVLVPCLILTLLLDLVGIVLLGSPFYSGVLYSETMSGPVNDVSLDPITFLGNIAFLQNIVVPVYGSNGPLWSIANEFWYYLAFPALFLAVSPRMMLAARLWTLGLVGLLLAVMGPSLAMLFPVWLMGYAAWFFHRARPIRRISNSTFFAVSTVGVLVATVVVIRALGISALWSSYAVGAAAAIALIGLRHPIFDRGKVPARWISRASYSLYLSHFPVLAVTVAFLGNRQFDTLSSGLLVYLLALGLCFGLAGAVYWFFESRTDAVRSSLSEIARAIVKPS